jgi:hypothetical protein
MHAVSHARARRVCGQGQRTGLSPHLCGKHRPAPKGAASVILSFAGGTSLLELGEQCADQGAGAGAPPLGHRALRAEESLRRLLQIGASPMTPPLCSFCLLAQGLRWDGWGGGRGCICMPAKRTRPITDFFCFCVPTLGHQRGLSPASVHLIDLALDLAHRTRESPRFQPSHAHTHTRSHAHTLTRSHAHIRVCRLARSSRRHWQSAARGVSARGISAALPAQRRATSARSLSSFCRPPPSSPSVQ